MRLELRITTPDARAWEALLADRPADLRLEARGGERVLYRAGAEATGVRLAREAGALLVAVPAFASFAELSMAGGLAEQIAKLTRGSISVSGQTVPFERFRSVFDDQIAIQFAEASVDMFVRMREAQPGELFAIDGVRRPYYLGRTSAARIAELADGDVYTKTSSLVASLQQLGAPTRLPGQLKIRTPDGETAIHALWDPRHETLLPPCDYVLVRESATTKVRVPHARIADVVTSREEGVVHGAAIDEVQWLLGGLDAAMAERVIARASTVGRRLELADPA